MASSREPTWLVLTDRPEPPNENSQRTTSTIASSNPATTTPTTSAASAEQSVSKASPSSASGSQQKDNEPHSIAASLGTENKSAPTSKAETPWDCPCDDLFCSNNVKAAAEDFANHPYTKGTSQLLPGHPEYRE